MFIEITIKKTTFSVLFQYQENIPSSLSCIGRSFGLQKQKHYFYINIAIAQHLSVEKTQTSQVSVLAYKASVRPSVNV